MSTWVALPLGFLIAVPGNWYAGRNLLFACWWYGFWAAGCTVLSALNAAQGSWGWAAITAGCAAINGYLWWQHRKRRKRKRAPALAGAKSRARVAALVRKVRETATPRRLLRAPAALAVVAVCAAACGPGHPVTPGTSSPAVTVAPGATQAPSGDHGNREAVRALGTQHCGIERWPVKTGTDADAAKVDLGTVQPTTIAHLAALPAPGVLPQAARVAPVEMTVYQVTATLREFKIEADGDVHAVLSDGTTTMIAEFPDPACVGGGSSNPFLPGITAARAAFGARFHPSDAWQQSGATVTVTGVGFWDYPHGQTGVAPNAIELHPVLGLGMAATP